METQKNNENILLELKRHLGKMMVQVDFLYRNGREIEQFDYDILMDRTRELYELLIDSQVNSESQEQNEDQGQNDEVINTDVEFEIETPKNESQSQNEDDVDDEDWEDEDDVTFHVEPLEINDKNDSNPVNLVNPVEKPNPVNPVDPVEKTNLVNLVNPVEKTNPVDNSLAARLQRQPISEIKSAVTLNDRIMMIHDLFKGSEERYNKTINVLNEFPTVGGALVYLNELGVEMLWDTESEAYLKLRELVERRFL